MSKPWQFEKVKPATSQTPALWAVQVGRKRIGYVRKASRDLYRAGSTPETADTMQGTRTEAAQWLYEGFRMAEAVKSTGVAVDEVGVALKRNAEYFKWKPRKEAAE